MKESVTISASLLAAVTASLCCIGPLAAALLGVGSFGAAAVLASWRPYLLGLAFALLAAAFYLTYRRREAACANGACQVTSASRSNKVLLWIAAIVITLFAAFPYYSASLLATFNEGSDQQAELQVGIPAQQPGKALLTDLKSFDQLRQQFRSESGKVRIISLLSPT